MAVLNAASIAKGVREVTKEVDAKASASRDVPEPAQEKSGRGAVPPASASPETPSLKQQYFDYAAETTRRASAEGVDLVNRAKAKVSAVTAETYAATYARRKEAVAKGGKLMGGVSRASWHSTRAAVMHGLAIEAAAAKGHQEAAYKAGDLENAIAWAGRRRALVNAAVDLAADEPPQERQKRKTKRETVPHDPAWRSRVFEAATVKQKRGVAILWATGCRPSEIEIGVDVTLVQEGGKRLLHIDVPGRKITEHSGQPHRRITIDAESEPGRALLSVMDGDTLAFRRRADVLNNDFARIRARLRKTGGVDWAISPYSMRHQMSADAKVHFKEILDKDEAIASVASLLGHRTTRSQGRYGHPRQAKGGGGLVAVQATHSIKKSLGQIEPKPVATAPRPRSDP